jgi:ATP-dependent Lhr-like helicase
VITRLAESGPTTIKTVPKQVLDLFHPAVRAWFSTAFPAPTRPQQLGWPAIARGESTLILAPTGTGKTLAAFLWCLNRLMFEPAPSPDRRCRVVYVSPLKALAVDVERNLRVPLAGIAAAAGSHGIPVSVPQITIRTGDTPARERARFLREPGDVLITTPESLFLLLTSNARERLRHVDTVIIDEIHALVPGKRGAHLALSLERLEELRVPRRTGAEERARTLQRIGLSATQRPLDEVARFLAGARRRGSGSPRRKPAKARSGRVRTMSRGDPVETGVNDLHEEFAAEDELPTYRPVTIVDASEPKHIDLRIELPVEERSRSDRLDRSGRSDRSIWASVHPRLLELIRSHTSTLVFVNNRRLAERLAAALNDLAGEPLVRAHHGSLARETRTEVEDLLKAGRIRALAATSALELGIDMGAIDLVVQIESPPSVASGLQRVGRAGHRAGAISEGIVFPKFRGDLVACAAVARAMHEGAVEPTRYPRNPLDVLAQQIVAMVATEEWGLEDLFATVRRAAPFATLSRRMFEGVLDMLAGRYPSDAFAELRPRITWNRVRNRLVAREGAKRVAVVNAGTIPDRGLYGVFLAGAERPTRVGELDEEMVFETKVGDTFTLGASTWRVEEITHDRVLVSPAPGEPGKMPFWHGDQAGRPVDLGYAIGRLVRELRSMPRMAAADRLVRQHALEPGAAEILLRYLDDQATSGGVPDDRTIVIERSRDDLGDWRVCLLSPLGSRIHAPWAMAASAEIRRRTAADVNVMWGDEGFVVRFPATDAPPDPMLLLPPADSVERVVVGQLGSTALFAARFRETAARALLLPRRRPGRRTPLWQQRKRATDLLAVASRYGSFPAILETYREILRDHFDMPALVETLRSVSAHTIRVITLDSRAPSPFAASLLFGYVANYIYDGDAPLAERRAQALSVDQAQLRELLGDAELRDLLDASAHETVEQRLQHLDERYRVRTIDSLHDLLLRIGDLSRDEIVSRSALQDVDGAIRALEEAGRVVSVAIGGEQRFIAVEDVARYRDAVGVCVPPGLPGALLAPAQDPAADLVLRFARSHGAFTAAEFAARYGLGAASADTLLQRVAREGRIIYGAFRPGRTEREWIDANVLHMVRRRSLARLRREVEPVETDAFARFLVSWHGIATGRRGPEALLDAIEQLQGVPIPASVLESEVLPARVDDYEPAQLDTLMAAGEVVWVGVEPLGERDGRIALYLTDQIHRLRLGSRPSRTAAGPPAESRTRAIARHLQTHGASFFAVIHEATGGGFPQETVDALWELVWNGEVTNDTLHPLRAFIRGPDDQKRHRSPHRFRSRRLVPQTAEGRWSLVEVPGVARPSVTEWTAATAQQMLMRHGIVTRETMLAEGNIGGFSVIYPVLKALEETGRVRRGYFIAGLGAAQFATSAAVEQLRQMREPPETGRTILLAATDPASPYGTSIGWPRYPASETADHDRSRGPTRSAGARVILVDGFAAAYLRRNEHELLLFSPDEEPRRSQMTREVSRTLRQLGKALGGLLIETINGHPAVEHPASTSFVESGFARTGMGLQLRSGSRVASNDGTTIAGDRLGGKIMAEPRKDDDLVERFNDDETRDTEQEDVRSSNDSEEQERAGTDVRHHDEAIGRESEEEDIDPDRAESDVDRDDSSVE